MKLFSDISDYDGIIVNLSGGQMGKSQLKASDKKWIPKALSPWKGNIITKNWSIPTGAFGKGGGAI